MKLYRLGQGKVRAGVTVVVCIGDKVRVSFK